MSGITPTQLTLRHLRALGYTAEVVETWNSFTRTRHDLFGFIDVIAVKGSETLAVQTTSATNVSSRVRKIGDSPNIGFIREAGWGIVVHGWAKKSNRWTLTREVDCS